MASRNRRGFGRRIILFIVGVVAVYLVYHFFFAHRAPPAAPQMPPASVSAVTVEAKDTPLIYEYAGRINGAREAEIRARVSGILLKRNYVEGAAVKRGDLLLQIDPAPFNAALNEAQAKLAQAQRDWERVQKLYQAKAVSEREYDAAKSTYEQAKAQTDTAKINLGYTSVRAPISGIISHEDVTEGTLVQADTTLLTRISQMDPIYIYFGAPDDESLALRQQVASGKVVLPRSGHLKAEIHLADGGTYGTLASVDFTDSIIDPTTGTVSMRAIVANRGGMLLPGQFVRVFLKGLVEKDAIEIPDSAVMQGPPGTFVYTVGADGKATITPIVLGKLNGELRIVESGLQSGDQVITEGMIKVQPGAPVNTAAPGSAPAGSTPASAGATKS